MTEQPHPPTPPNLRFASPLPSSARVLQKSPRPLPVLPGTLLSLELMLFQPSSDLRRVSHLLCADPGALLHLFAALAEETGRVPETPCRIEDCIASLPLDRLLERLVSASGANLDHVPVVAFSRHAVAISRYAQVVAESLGFPAEQASLVGLLHELGTLPWVLGWNTMPSTPVQAALSCEQLCVQYCLPSWLCHTLMNLHSRSQKDHWAAVIDAAHELSQQDVSPA